MQFKILEAMACGVPVVTTPLGLGDIAAITNEAILVAEEPTEFSKHIINLINDSALNFKIGSAGYKYVNNNHDDEMLNTKFLKEIERHR
jgi:glycosyltransferase involved in cell wall biosynthesis